MNTQTLNRLEETALRGAIDAENWQTSALVLVLEELRRIRTLLVEAGEHK